jgi:hypothetical protein
MFTTLTNGGPLAGPRWSATTMRVTTGAGDQAHMAASGRQRPSCKSGAAPDHESRADKQAFSAPFWRHAEHEWLAAPIASR